MNKPLLLFLTAFFLLSPGAKAQDRMPFPEENERNVQTLDVENGLPQGYVNGIVQDSIGFIWLGTRDGLARFDGYEVKTFHYDPGDTSTIASDVIQTIYRDRGNRIWILYENGAVDIFDPLTEEVRHLRANGPLGWMLKGRKLRPFVLRQDSRGTYWFVLSGLKHILRFTWDRPQPVPVRGARGEHILAVEEGADGQMYACTLLAFYRIVGDSLHKMADLPRRREIRNDRIGEMVQDRKGNWVIMNNGYLDIFTPGEGWKVVEPPRSSAPTPNYFLQRSPAGDIYFNDGGRVFRLNTDYSLDLIWANRSRPGNITAMTIDRSNVLWAGTNTFGARSVNLSFNGFHSFTPEEGSVYDLLKRGLDVSNSGDYRGGNDPYGMRSAYDRENSLWLMAQKGPPVTLAPGGRLERPPAAGNSFDWLQFTFDAADNCWSIVVQPRRSPAGERGKGQDTLLAKADLRTGTVSPEAAWRPAFSEIGYLAAYHNKLCIVYSEGIELYDPATGKSLRYGSKEVFGNVKLLMACPDPRDSSILWITSLGHGLIRFDTRTSEVKAFTVKEEIPSNSVYAIVPDEKGNLWCSSNKGIFRFDPESHEVLSFVAKDGLQGNEFNRYHFLRSPGGRIFFGGTRGWTVFHPDSIRVDPYRPDVVITGILVNNAPVTELPSRKGTAVTSLSSLSLSYDQNFITFTFAGLQFSNAGKLKYRYRLEGLDRDWIGVGTQRIANYTNLPPGDYLFKVNCSNEAGIWGSHIKTFPFTIHPPWWETWWAKTLYAFLIGTCGVLFYRYRLNRLRVQRQMAFQQEEARQLRALGEMKTRFFSNITHELRTPLSLIIAPLEQIRQEQDIPPSVKTTLAGVRRNARQLLGLINQLLDMSKIEEGNMEVSLSRGDMGLFVAENIQVFTVPALQKNIRLNFNSDLREEYDFDADKWQKILINLLSNAIKFTPSGGLVEVSLSVRYDNGVSHAIMLEVKDSGIGIPEDRLPYVFNRFYQVDDSRTRAYGGTGIGLALVRELTELMNGIVEVESRPGSGTLFRVLIPVEKASEKPRRPLEQVCSREIDEEAEQRTTADAAAPAEGKEAALILLAEDNEELNSFIARSLGADYRVLTAANGKEALVMAREHLPDLIISDIMMPEMDGYVLCREIKGAAETDHIALILLSAKAAHESVVKGLENHADDYITKPFHIDELRLRVRNLIDRQGKLRDHYYRQLTAPGDEFQGQTVTNGFLKRLYTVVEGHLNDPQFDVGALASRMGVTRRTLNRKLSMLVNLSASEVVKQYRLKRAARLLRSGMNVSETAYGVGFASVSYFSNSFKEFYGVVPSAYMNS